MVYLISNAYINIFLILEILTIWNTLNKRKTFKI